MLRFLVPSLILILTSCSLKKSLPEVDELTTLKTMMTGSFNSAEQASQDSSYYDISLQMYPIWEDRPGHWLYVEQAVTAMLDKPYRQRVYQLKRNDQNIFESIVYTLVNQDDFIGKYDRPDFFDNYDESILELREGCTVYLEKADNFYWGSTLDKDCKSSLRGASYATSKVKIYKNEIQSWDQGFDDDGNQVWGATKGGYIFKKLQITE